MKRIRITLNEKLYQAVIQWKNILKDDPNVKIHSDTISTSYAFRTAIFIGLHSVVEFSQTKALNGLISVVITLPDDFYQDISKRALNSNVTNLDVIRTALFIATSNL